jgi:hypothetical protein
MTILNFQTGTQAMEACIAWELGLATQLEQDGTSDFNPV